VIAPVGDRATVADAAGPAALVWLDAREAVIVRWANDEATFERVRSDVPARRRSTGHVRHDPLTRHGGGGESPPDAGERRRLEHLARYLDGLAERLAAAGDVVLAGSRTVCGQLETRLRAADAGSGRTRAITSWRTRRPTDGQLVARLREHVGAGPKRRRVGGDR
jgi:hypothetical protein